jgi:hypothetical protein
VDLYLIVPLRPRSARMAFALVRFMPTRFGILTVGMVVGGAVDVVGKVVVTVGKE